MKKLFLILSVCLSCIISAGPQKSFIESFVASYDIFPQGRYSRGYPDYLATKSKDSLISLENAVSESGFDIVGRMVISGYEQNAVPSYRFDLEEKKIDDESNKKGDSGWSFAPGNMFGFTTGFMLKDCNLINNGNIFKHIDNNRVEIFDDQAEVLQKYAFGNSYQTILNFKTYIERAISKNDFKKVISLLAEYWKTIYLEEQKKHDASVVATQDILFSILYATYLRESNIKPLKFFTGPDITYPIRVLPVQPLEATGASQDFLREFVTHLKSIENKKTAYIFCSFVDGVGKSTLLGNIINWLKFKDDFVSYEPVNNSSSQAATLYKFDDAVFIADLPAQISHYCAKPVGYVFVDINSCKLPNQLIKKINNILKNDLINTVKVFFEKFNSYDKTTCASTFYDQYIKNLCDLGIEAKWIPFEVEEKLFVFNPENNQLRVLVSLDDAHSSGLKVREPELMIFDGAILPMDYNFFLKDLTSRMKEQGIEKVVFVDFISMYPRSSRENIRINFMLQQLKALFGDKFNIRKSFYRDFANHYELYPLIKSTKNELVDSLVLETISRDVLNEAIISNSTDFINKLTFDELINLMKKQLDSTSKSKIDAIYSLAKEKIELEFKPIKYFKYSKFVESCWNSPLNKMTQLSDAMRDLFSKSIKQPVLNNEWSNIDKVATIDELAQMVYFTSGAKAHILAVVPEGCHNQAEIEKIVHGLKVTYYFTILDILGFDYIDKVFPAILLLHQNNMYYLVQKVNDQYSISMSKFLSIKTHVKEFVYGYDPEDIHNTLNQVYLEEKMYGNINTAGEEFFIPVSTVCYYLDRFNWWNSAVKNIATKVSSIARNIDSLILIARALATIEALLKAPKCDIMTRYNSKKDFISTLRLIENIFLPMYAGLTTKIFNDYRDIEPLIQLDWKIKR